MCGETSYRAKTAREREKAPDAMVKSDNDATTEFLRRKAKKLKGVPRGS
jgi:hypothetical protein